MGLVTGPFPQQEQLSLYGTDPFQVGADQLVAALSEMDSVSVPDLKVGRDHVFPAISVGIWRDATKKDMAEWASEKKENGEYEIDRT